MDSRRVLVIEDDADTRHVFSEVLESEGFEVSTAANGQEGLDRLAAIEPPCVILLDLMMPVMDGLEFLEHFHARREVAAIPVLLVSAYHELAATAEGVAGFIRKPVQLVDLVNAVQGYCGPSA